jgi:hypothetical protein
MALPYPKSTAMILSYTMAVSSTALQRNCCSKTKLSIENHAGLKPLNYGLNKQPALLNKTPSIHRFGNTR